MKQLAWVSRMIKVLGATWRMAQQGGYPERYEVLEFWGYVDTEILEDNGVRIPRGLKMQSK